MSSSLGPYGWSGVGGVRLVDPRLSGTPTRLGSTGHTYLGATSETPSSDPLDTSNIGTGMEETANTAFNAGLAQYESTRRTIWWTTGIAVTAVALFALYAHKSSRRHR